MSGEAVTFIEIGVPVCSLTYGVAPCTASLVSSPPTGTEKCLNCLSTCQDTANINLQNVTLRFAVEASYLPRDIDIVAASVLSVDHSPSIVSLGENLGQRASVKVTFKDHKHSDAGPGLDKYHAERGYDPYEQGTFWGRFRPRQPYLRGRALRWITGFVGQALDEMETRHFFIESFDGPGVDGKFSITAKDCLKFLDGDRAQAPVLSNGFLVAAIDDNDGSATLSPAGIGNTEYPTSGYVNIGGSEVCAFTRSGDTLTITRAQLGTVASSHSEQDRVQLCVRFDAQDPADIIADLLEDYTDTPTGYIQRAAWLIETEANFGRLLTATITEPTPVNKLISEIVEQAALAIWDDNINQVIRLQVLRAVPTNAALYDDANILKGTFNNAEQPDKRLSQVWIYFGQIDPTKRIEDADNYRSTELAIDDDAEANYGVPAIKKIFSRWIPALGRSVATRLGVIVLGRYSVPPRKFSFGLFRGSVDTPQMGTGYRLNWWNLQDATGARENVPVQITRLLPRPEAWAADAEEMLFNAPPEDLDNRQIVIDFNVNNINLRTVHDQLYPALEVGQTVTCTVAAGVIVGSTSVAVPAFDVGDWDGSPDITVQILGRLQGKGGNGGRGAPTSAAGEAGQSGGDALKTTVPINLIDEDGEIFGGGGGGGGGGISSFTGGGGGGGAGQVPGSGGATRGIGVFSGMTDGQPGTTELGGAGGVTTQSNFGGAGGDPGQAGQAGGAGVFPGGAGASAGNAINGISLVTTVGSAGDRRGGTIN